MADFKLLTEMFYNNIRSVEIPMSLECNHRCAYCYITDDYFKTKKVSLEEVKKIIDACVDFFPGFNQPGEAMIVPWGSEPMCNWEVVRDSLLYAFSLPVASTIRTRWSTNGSICHQDLIDFIKTYSDRIKEIQISIDGNQNIHDYSRKLITGQSSYQLVRRTMETIYRECPNFIDRITYKATLHPEQLELSHYDQAVEFFLTEVKLTIDPVTLVTDRPYTTNQIKSLRKSFDVLKQKWDKIKKVNEKAEIGYFHSIKNNIRRIHCSACTTSVAVDLDGSIQPCHGSITTTSFYKNTYRIGNVFTKTIDEKGLVAAMCFKYNNLLYRRPLCRNCIVYHTYYDLCYNCPYESLVASSSSFLPPLSVCEIRRVIIEKYLEWKKDGLL